jgi:hypothetical protein
MFKNYFYLNRYCYGNTKHNVYSDRGIWSVYGGENGVDVWGFGAV